MFLLNTPKTDIFHIFSIDRVPLESNFDDKRLVMALKRSVF